MPEHLEIPEDMQIKPVKTLHSDMNTAHKGSSDDKMLIELISSQKGPQGHDGKTAKAHADSIVSKLQKLIENKTELKEKRKNSIKNLYLRAPIRMSNIKI